MVSVEYNHNEILNIILENVTKMFHRRLFKNCSYEEESSNIYVFKCDDTIFKIYINSSKMISILKKSSPDIFLSDETIENKIFISRELTKKMITQIKSYNSEFFFEREFLEDIPSKIFIPKHQLLTNEEKKEFLKCYSESELSKIFYTDVMSRYYKAQPGDIFRILRPSNTAGYNIFYRKVINNSIENMII